MDLDRAKLLKLYESMATIRNFEDLAYYEMGQRQLGNCHSSAGQEAVPTGVCAHLQDDDYIASTHRGHGHCIAKGVDPKLMMAELFGRETGTNKGKGGSMHIADMSRGMLGTNGVVGASVPLALGAALTSSVKGTAQVAVAFFGDGGANQGVLHESMNLASIWSLPVIFVCENNQYAESTPVEYALSVENEADRAAAYSMPGEVVDGMDVFAVYEATGRAVERARSGEGPSLIECKTYRWNGHSLPDNPRRYRSEEEEKTWKERDPLLLFRKRVLQEESLTQEDLDQIDENTEQLIKAALEFADDSPFPQVGEIYTDVYVDYPEEAFSRGTGMEF